MSVLSDLLEELLEAKDININQLSKLSGISRATLHHYVHGHRSIQKQEHFESIINSLTLSPQQLKRMKDAYLIETIGEPLYRQRRQVYRFFRNLGSIQEGTLLDELTLPDLQPEEMAGTKGESFVIADRSKVTQTIFNVIREASESQGIIMLYADPLSVNMKAIMNSPILSNNASDFHHIFRMETVSFNKENKNFGIIEAVVKYATVIQKYKPQYFYESVTDAETVFQLTEFIVSEHEVVQFSKKGDYAIRHTKKEIVELFQGIFKKMSEKCISFGHAFDFAINSRNYYIADIFEDTSFVERPGKNKVMCVSGTISIANIWNETLIRKYLRKDFAEYEMYVENLTKYSQLLQEMMYKKNGVYMMKSDALRDFFRTGKTSNYQDAFVKDAISKEDRKYVAQQMIRRIENGEEDVALFETDVFPVNEMWDGLVFKDKMILFNYHWQSCVAIPLHERSFTYAVFDYFQSLADGENAVRGKAAIGLLQRWIREYLN